MIERQGKHIQKLLDGLLDVSRIVSGKFEMATSPVDLARIGRDATEDVGMMVEDLEHRLQVTLPSPDEVWVTGDAVRLAEVCNNLLTNACKYTPRGGRIGFTIGAESM